MHHGSTSKPQRAATGAVCNACGRQWPRHPSLEVACPKCGAAVGAGCLRPSGHSGPLIDPHVEREQRAVDEGVLALCPEGPTMKGRRPRTPQQRRKHDDQSQPSLPDAGPPAKDPA